MLSTLVADTTLEGGRVVAYGVNNLASGTAMQLRSAIGGRLWDTIWARVVFVGGAAFALIALALFLTPRNRAISLAGLKPVGNRRISQRADYLQRRPVGDVGSTVVVGVDGNTWPVAVSTSRPS
jgi:hypothetical protein